MHSSHGLHLQNPPRPRCPCQWSSCTRDHTNWYDDSHRSSAPPSFSLSSSPGKLPCGRTIDQNSGQSGEAGYQQYPHRDWVGEILFILEQSLRGHGDEDQAPFSSAPVLNGNLAANWSRLLQQQWELSHAPKRQVLFQKLWPYVNRLVIHPNGNYVVQKMLYCGNDSQQRLLVGRVTTQVNSWSSHVYGCRVVQAAICCATPQELEALVRGLNQRWGYIRDLIYHQYGNYVVQTLFQSVPPDLAACLVGQLRGMFLELAYHGCGCRVIQSIFKHTPLHIGRLIMDEVRDHLHPLSMHRFGNYVVQEMFKSGERKDAERVFAVVRDNLPEMCRSRFASHVVEKFIEEGSDQQRHVLLQRLTLPDYRGDTELQILQRHQFGSHVVRKLYLTMDRPRQATVNKNTSRPTNTLSAPIASLYPPCQQPVPNAGPIKPRDWIDDLICQ